MVDDVEWLEAMVRDQIAYAKSQGLHIYLSKALASHCRRLSLWDDAVHVEVKPLPTRK